MPRIDPAPVWTDAHDLLGLAIELDEEFSGSSALVFHPAYDRAGFQASRDRGYVTTLIPGYFAGLGRVEFGRHHASPRLLFVEARDRTDNRVVDLVGIDMADPSRFGTLLGRAAWLDESSAHADPATRGGRPLRLHRDPLAWIRAGCAGAVLLDPERAWSELPDLSGPVLCQDQGHAREIGRLTRGYLDPARIRVPRHG